MKNKYLVKYHYGLGANAVFEAETEVEAKKLAIAEYRRTAGTWETVDMLPVDIVIQDIVMLEQNEKELNDEH